jgi:serine/tyrosine/threonine adenylyltransferase
MKVTNLFTSQLEGDPIIENYQRQVEHACYSFVSPTAVTNPKVLAVSKEMVELLNMEQDWVDSDEFIDVMSGNKNISDARPYAMCYGGHQFGHWAGQLGDGRAINVADISVDGQAYTLQLKGSGRTPYSRTADGLAVLRSSIREYLCSEAMFHLGVATTRALSLVSTGEKVYRDMFYDGNAAYEPGAIVCRVAESFIRFGNYQILTSRGDIETLKSLVDFTISNFYSHLGKPSKEVYIQWLKEVAERTVDMVIDWQRVGFVHGVMNTDNMSILGLTIDYGPYGWLENYDPKWTPNTTDGHGKRYAFGNQPNIAMWNIIQLFNAIFPLIDDKESMQKVVDDLTNYFSNNYQQMLVKKLGFSKCNQEGLDLVKNLFGLMEKANVDYIIFFRNLSLLENEEVYQEIPDFIIESFYDELSEENNKQWISWLSLYQNYCNTNEVHEKSRVELIKKTNPKYVLRNYIAFEVIEKAESSDMSLFSEIEDMLKHPYTDNPKYDHWYKKRPDWAKTKAGCSMLSCSS